MSSNILQVNYDEAGQIAQTLRAEGEEIARLHTQTRQRLDAIHREWRGDAARAFQQEMNDALLPATLRASNALFAAERVLVEIVSIIRQADEETAGYFKGLGGAVIAGAEAGAQAGSTSVSGGTPPGNMQELADLVMNGPSPICVYQVGPNEYLVTIKGTDPLNPNASPNWGSAIETGLGLPTEYQNKVKEALLSLPEGANVHMAGYSQGGIVAQNLAGDGGLNLNIKSITTFGSPYSAPQVSGIDYQRFAAHGDPVPYLEGRDAKVAAAATLLLSPFVGAKVAGNALLDRYPQTAISGDINPLAAHGIYSNSDDLKGYSTPFNATSWNSTPIITSNGGSPNSPLAIINQYVGNAAVTSFNGVIDAGKTAGQFTGNLIQSGVSAAQDTWKHTNNFFGNFL